MFELFNLFDLFKTLGHLVRGGGGRSTVERLERFKRPSIKGNHV